MNQDLKTSLEELADAEYADAPPSTVDIGRARAVGRRRIATARVAPVAGGLAVVAACALVANGLGGTSPAERPESAPALSGTFTGTDPLPEIASFGYLPDGYKVATHTMASGLTTVILQTKPMLPSEKAGYLNPAELHLSSSPTELKPVAPATTTEVKVKGSPKAYIEHDGDGTIIPDRLQWQTASGSWFTLAAFNKIHGAQLQAMLVRVADSVTANGSAVPMPIHIEGVPKGATLDAAELADPIVVGQNPPAVRTSLEFGDGKSRFISFSVIVIPVGWTDPQSTVPLSAYPKLPDDGTTACKHDNGLQICVLDSHAGISGVDPLDSVGGAKGLLDRITSFGTDRANWTTQVLN
ncbi:hypothetical protein [Catenulispora rubra]|uniref:hypothetical protein n=1 Tax=Catenulispora rubra TaxID=280293 RepID=UPI0018926FB9|nr:hypothetical protein [Catenulispora rubra]